MNALETLAHWVAAASADNYPTQWQQAIDWTNIALFDTLGVMIGGSDHPSPSLGYQTVSQWGSGFASVVGQSSSLAPPWAAFVNGAAAHALDFNAWDEPSASHSIPVLLAALLAIAEVEGKSGADVIDAFIVGEEVLMRIGLAVNLDHYHIGWHTTSTVSAIGCAAACARLLGLNETEIGHAMSIATSQATGYKSQFGTPMKPIHCGMGAKTGVMSAYLAQSGMEASTQTLDGKWSFLTLQATPNAPGFDTALASLGDTLLLAEYGIVIKPYPSCAYTHRSIDGLLDLMAEHGFGEQDVAQISATIPYFNASILPYTHPIDDTQARFCMAFCLATALQNNGVLPHHFADEMIEHPVTTAWLEKIELRTHAITADSSDMNKPSEPAIISVTLKDGTVLENSTDYARGMKKRPLSKTELETKFIGLAQPKLGMEKTVELMAQLWQFSQIKNINSLMQPLKQFT